MTRRSPVKTWAIRGMVLAGIAIVAAGLLALSVLGSKWSEVVAFYTVEGPAFAIMSLGVVTIALLIVFISQWVRNRPWFDRYGAAVEMGTVQRRIGTNREKPNDAIAVGIQYSGTSLLIATIVLGFFLIHD